METLMKTWEKKESVNHPSHYGGESNVYETMLSLLSGTHWVVKRLIILPVCQKSIPENRANSRTMRFDIYTMISADTW
jgi:hypothetical protein